MRWTQHASRVAMTWQGRMHRYAPVSFEGSRKTNGVCRGRLNRVVPPLMLAVNSAEVSSAQPGLTKPLIRGMTGATEHLPEESTT
jgi:hypothetical protein